MIDVRKSIVNNNRSAMLGNKKYEPKLIYKLTLDDLVPEDNLYRVLLKFLDLRFLYKECKKLYGTTGKPSIDPVVFFKLQIFGYLENIISDRELIRRASDSLSARYFLGYDMDESLPWHSTISRTRGLIGREIFESLFDKVLELCNASGLIEGKHQTIDSTLVKANASLESLQRKEPQLSVVDYVNQTFAENSEEKQDDQNDRGDDNRENGSTKRNDIYESKTDPDSKITFKPGKPTDLYYKTQYCADTKGRIITDVLVSFADRDDKNNLIESIDRAQEKLKKFNKTIETASADRGYCSGRNLRELEKRNITAYIPNQRSVNNKGGMHKDQFQYDKQKDVFICPNQKVLKYYRYDKKKERRRYISNKGQCSGCPLKEKCCPNAPCRTVCQSIYYKEYDRLNRRLKTPDAREAYILRKIISEGLFAEAKNSHGLRKFMSRGLEKAHKRSYMIASVQNLKRLLKHFRKGAYSIKIYFTNQLYIFINRTILCTSQ
jgi:transposase